MKYEFYIARKHLKAHGGVFKRIIAWISIVGICVGVATLLIVMSVMNGLHIDLRNRILKATPDIMVLKFHGEPIDDYNTLREKIEESVGVTKVLPYIFTKTMIKGKKNRMDGIMVRGELEQPDVKDNIIWGEYNTEENGIVLGKNLAGVLGVFISDTVTLYGFPYGRNPGLLNLRSRNFVVRGIFDIGLYDFNATLAYTSLPLLQDFFSLGDRVTGIEVEVDDIDNADGIAKNIEESIGYPYYVTSWKELNTNLFEALSLEKFTMFVLLTLVIIVAAFNIVATLLMTVIGKTREIGILLSIGASPSSIRKIFVLQGLIIGIIGTFMGTAIGWTACELLSRYHFIKIPAEVYNISTLPVSMQFSDFLIVPIATICISLLASLYPAWRASKLEPVEAIRYE
ncbi:hypothetical protein CH333_04600 [candidate division WOR-3 bacterium JGI_Cruoil_03_44_89]|uniref:ABC transporter permease n=1 Tax=candidate division WOR-3 bacterium JGI_Cruoil_03_44_89 TaxID=1973748 RepID=A0A235BUU7_UNCW3|nr:MAG: hypothetical protein CH333_04600 [candidate division WOR-3 bacterium JGI_Cruoil_03_44_89]